jgi:hypothetical protein
MSREKDLEELLAHCLQKRALKGKSRQVPPTLDVLKEDMSGLKAKGTQSRVQERPPFLSSFLTLVPSTDPGLKTCHRCHSRE